MSNPEFTPSQNTVSIEDATQTRTAFIRYCILLGTTEDMYSEGELQTMHETLQLIGQRIAQQTQSQEHIAEVISMTRFKNRLHSL